MLLQRNTCAEQVSYLNMDKSIEYPVILEKQYELLFFKVYIRKNDNYEKTFSLSYENFE